MNVLVPIDGSDCSYRALAFAAEFVTHYEGTLHVVHFANRESDSTRRILTRAEEHLDEAGVLDDPEVVSDLRVSDIRYGKQIGKDILSLVEQREYDHVVMGHHGSDAVGRLLLGSAAETVIRAAETPATVIP